MNTVRTLALATIAGAGVAANAISNGTPQGEAVEVLPVTTRDGTCDELPKLCTGPAMMYGYATTLTYLCPEASATKKPLTVHVTVTKTTTVTPYETKTTGDATGTLSMAAPTITGDSDTTTTIRSTLTEYKTVTVFGNTDVPTPINTVSIPAIAITGYLSATIPTELLSSTIPSPTETKEPIYTIQTSLPAMTSSHGFPTMSPPVANGTITGIFYSAPLANSSALHPTPFFPNTTSVYSHYTLPTLNVANRAAETPGSVKGAAGKASISLMSLVLSMMMVTVSV